jgi:hypothetical protein
LFAERSLVVASAVAVGACAALRPLPAPAPGVRCLQEEVGFRDPRARALDEFASPHAQRTWKLGAFDSAGVALVGDRAVCGRASRALGEVPAGPDVAGRRRPRYSDVVVVRLGQSGYMVHAFWHQFGNGHYYCDRVLMDARFRNVKYLCS